MGIGTDPNAEPLTQQVTGEAPPQGVPIAQPTAQMVQPQMVQPQMVQPQMVQQQMYQPGIVPVQQPMAPVLLQTQTSIQQPPLAAHGIFGTSRHTAPSADLKGAIPHYDFAPAPCVCCGCLIPESLQRRTFLRAYGNRAEMNRPVAPCCCMCDDEKYMADKTWLAYYDKPPFRAGMLCICIPAICCGPPVIFADKPKFCCIDLSDCYGQKIMYAPCNCYGLRKCCGCCGEPCYMKWAKPIITGVKDPEQFLAVMKREVRNHAAAHGVPVGEVAVFDKVSDNAIDVLGNVQNISAAQQQPQVVQYVQPASPQYMARP